MGPSKDLKSKIGDAFNASGGLLELQLSPVMIVLDPRYIVLIATKNIIRAIRVTLDEDERGHLLKEPVHEITVGQDLSGC